MKEEREREKLKKRGAMHLMESWYYFGEMREKRSWGKLETSNIVLDYLT